MLACLLCLAMQEDAERLASHAAASTSGSISKQGSDFTSSQQRALFSLCDSYADVFYAGKPYPGGPGWHPGQPDEAMDAVLLHVLNHCAKTADVIKKNNDKLKGLEAGGWPLPTVRVTMYHLPLGQFHCAAFRRQAYCRPAAMASLQRARVGGILARLKVLKAWLPLSLLTLGASCAVGCCWLCVAGRCHE